MQFSRVKCNNKERLHSPDSQRCRHTSMCRNSTCSWIIAWHTFRRHFSGIFVVTAHHPGSYPPDPIFPFYFHCYNNVTDSCSSCCVGDHGWVARICQPWEQSSSRSWLPIVDTAGCLKHPTSILVMQLLMSYQGYHLTFSAGGQLVFTGRKNYLS